MFDSYVQGSIKDSERIRRQDKAIIEMNSIHYDTPLPIEMNRIWPSSCTSAKKEHHMHNGSVNELHLPSQKRGLLGSTSPYQPCNRTAHP